MSHYEDIEFSTYDKIGQNDQFCHMLKIWYLRNETSYDDIRHGVRKLKTSSFWSEKFWNGQNGQKWLKISLKMFKNTVWGYQKGLKPQNIFSDFENMYFQLSNALSIVFIRCLDTKIQNIEIWVSRVPPRAGLKKILI